MPPSETERRKSRLPPSDGSRDAASFAQGDTPAVLRLQWAGVAAFAMSAVWLWVRLAPGAAAAPWLTLTAVLLAYLGADLICGLVHWAADTWGPPDLPVVGRAFLRPFREHHLDPAAITRHNFAETNGNSCLVSLPVLGLAGWLAPGVSGSGTIFLSAFLGALVCWVVLTNQFHKLAHLPKPGRVVALLQRLHLILPPAHHAHHHARPFNTHYCITLGWMNGPIERLRLFRRLEGYITQCTGAVPRGDDFPVRSASGVGADVLPLRLACPLPRPVRPPGRVTPSSQMENHPAVPADERAEIVDALYRFAAGLNLQDSPLLASAFSHDATVDLTSPARRLGTALPLFNGRRAVANALITLTARLDTTHSVTNPRVTAYDGKQATLSALVEEQYQPKEDCRRLLILKNVYTVELSRDNRRWVITHLKVDNTRVAGDGVVLWRPLALVGKAVVPTPINSRRCSSSPSSMS